MDKSAYTAYLPLTDVTINDHFWEPVMERVRNEVIPYQWEALNDRVPGAEPSYCMRNFKLAAEITHPELDYGVDRAVGHGGFVFQDSDFAKWLEAVAYSLVWHPDPALEQLGNEAIDIVCNAQQLDGYLDTYYIITGLEKRFTNLKDNHELYCLGHFLEAAVAWYHVRGKRKLLDALIRYVDCVDAHIGSGPGKLPGYPGHEILELALVRLYEITGDEKHLRLATYFIDQRGQSPLFFAEETKRNNNDFYWKDSPFRYQYYQAGKPVRDQRTAEGHAVRATYLYSGMADIAKLTGDDTLMESCNAIWDNIVNRQLYITGGIGQSAHGESFSWDYDLPNDTVYAETCASIGLVFFARRMASIAPKGTFADVQERALFNGIISGMSLDGKAFFYVNPLEVLPEACEKGRNYQHVKVQRQKWFGCACCPPNVARLLASLGSYIHSSRPDALYTHLFVGSEAKLHLGGRDVQVIINTRYPWEQRVHVTFKVDGAARFLYGLRVPGWCGNYRIRLNGAAAPVVVEDGYAILNREWHDGDRIEAVFEMPVSFVQANPKVRQNIGKVAVTRGPLVYCLEEADNGPGLFKVHAGKPDDITVEFTPGLLEGVTAISFTGKKEPDWEGDTLYRPLGETALEDKALFFIPYYAWANRAPGEMTVWINR
ncbi:hypothetical protein FACS189493_1790 [Spirochaetia bacterium]|nr:hypothetical protein FACS189493_1790 [Spirochaetia bacterium]